jgi:hypothetical protein
MNLAEFWNIVESSKAASGAGYDSHGGELRCRTLT